MDEFWGMEFVEVVDPKQPEGTKPDSMTAALLEYIGYYNDLRARCYAEQFDKVVMGAIVRPALAMLARNGFFVSDVRVRAAQIFGELAAEVWIEELRLELRFRDFMLTDHHVPNNISWDIAHQVEQKYRNDIAQSILNRLSPEERDYVELVGQARDFNEWDKELYLHPLFERFRNAGSLIKRNGFYALNDDMVRVWRLMNK